MHVCMYASMHIYASMQVCKYMEVCKTSSLSCHVKPKRSVLYPQYEIFKPLNRVEQFLHIELSWMDLGMVFTKYQYKVGAAQ